MRAAFVTGALAGGFGIALLATAVVWIVTLTSGSTAPWASAAWFVPLLGVLGAAATYVGEVIVHRLTQDRRRETGEPWAFRED